MTRRLRLFAALGPSDVVAVANGLADGENEVVSETSIAFSIQMLRYLQTRGIDALVSTSSPRIAHLDWGRVRVENVPRRWDAAPGLRYYLGHLDYAFRLAWRARRMGAELALLDSGTVPYFMLPVFRVFGIPVAINFHNVRWPAGSPPRGRKARLLRKLDSWAFRHVVKGAIGCSPECRRQFEADGVTAPFHEWRAQFRPEGFSSLPAPSPRPFTILFVGRMEESKGVFDLLKSVEMLHARLHCPIRVDICGDGPALGALRDAVHEAGLSDIVHLHGRLDRPQILERYAAADVLVVPSKTAIGEGMPMVCAEAALAGLPIITSRVSSALDVLGGAILEARPDDVSSYADALEKLATDTNLREGLAARGRVEALQFLDRSFSYPAAVDRLLEDLLPEWSVLADYEAVFAEVRPPETLAGTPTAVA